ncbi:MAG: ATP-dependent DNA helicase RecG, partial [Clostridiales bacterium]|nr:ATP-dependent DNA helicase RecG [Clostridiales bacterium]
MNLSDSITSLKSVGEKRAALLNKLGVYTIKNLLEFYPRDYEDRSVITPIGEIMADEANIIRAKIASAAETTRHANLFVTKIRLEDVSGSVTAVWYNQPYMKNNLIKGREYIFAGKAVYKFEQIQFLPYDYELVKTADGEQDANRIIPKYPLVAGLSAKLLRGWVTEALNQTAGLIEENLPPEIIEKYGFLSKKETVINIHFPKDNGSFYKARQRLVFEELFGMQLSLLQTKSFVKSQRAGTLFADLDIAPVMRQIPFTLTAGQQNAVNELLKDLAGDSAMNSLLQGDVGSGKTVIAAIICYVCAKNGYQAAMMAPTEVLAKQHFDYFTNLFAALGIETVLLSGSMSAKGKRAALESISMGKAKMVIGTHAVIQDGVTFKNLALAITDEQHRFGVRQRRVLSEKGTACHMLVMTATPIPRSLALILYADMDICAVYDKPPGRQDIDTFAVTGKYRSRIFSFVKGEIEKGNQAYFICPAISEAENSELKAVTAYVEEAARNLQGISVAALHGKMKQTEKDFIMDEFKAGRIKALISTTVIEVGVNVPAATVIVIEDAERFGLSQLHQLRGRVGRGKSKSYCVLITDSRSKVTKKRMEAIKSTQNGFTLSKLDLEIRGP